MEGACGRMHPPPPSSPHLDDVADVVGQAAVGEAHVGAALVHSDVGRLREAPQARGAGCAARDAADDRHALDSGRHGGRLRQLGAGPTIRTGRLGAAAGCCSAARARDENWCDLCRQDWSRFMMCEHLLHSRKMNRGWSSRGVLAKLWAVSKYSASKAWRLRGPARPKVSKETCCH